MKIKYVTAALLSFMMCANIVAQNKLTKDQILSMSIEQLSDLPLEDLMDAVETLGVSSVDELFSMIMNKNVSSASKEEENSFTSPLSTSVVTKAELRTYGITTIEEAFRLISGMIVTEKTNGIYDVQMRGLYNLPDNNMLLYSENAGTLLMVDSRPVQNYAMGALTMDMLHISIEDIDRIEVVRGASSALYGANAVSGVINIITEKPVESNNIVSGSMQMGSQNSVIGDMAFRKSWMDGKFAAGLTVNLQRRGRDTDKLYVMPQADLYRADSDKAKNSRYSQVQIADLANLSSDYTDVSAGGWMNVEDVNNLRFVRRTTMPTPIPTYLIMNATEPQTPVGSMFSDPGVSRKTMGINGYLSFIPAKDIRVDIQAGYQSSNILSTPVNDDVFSLNNRISKGAYVNVNSTIHDLTLNLSYDGGPQNYAYGVPGFKEGHNSFNVSAEYDLHLGDLHLKPGVSAQYVKYKDYLPVYNSENPMATGDFSWHYEKDGKPADSRNRLFGFFDGTAKITNVAPSLRLDYKINGIRLIGAFRSDKTSIPDKWNHSWLFSANYSFNDRNFIRFVYGRANRGATMVNSSANYQWTRTYMMPAKMVFIGNKESDLVHIDNYELGYRWKPANNILVDAELYVSHSEDYGALMASRTMQVLSKEFLGNLFNGAIPQVGAILSIEDKAEQQAAFAGIVGQVSGQMVGNAECRSYVKYENLPYKVNQYGVSVNVDWIISPKLIAKVNANVQQTRIDDYFPYSQAEQVAHQLAGANSMMASSLASGAMMSDILQTAVAFSGGDKDKAQQTLATILGHSDVAGFRSRVGWDNMDAAGQQEVLDQLKGAAATGTTLPGAENPLNMYYALKYNVLLNVETDEYFIGATDAVRKPLTNDHKHKATPAVYGMAGLIYKPTHSINVSAFANYVGKRTMDTAYGSVDLKARTTVNLKVGYSPIENMEIFFNAHNLFNTKDREFVYSDNIGGLYTFGINFAL